jgi:DNA polymerase
MSDDVLLHRSLPQILESLHRSGMTHVSWPKGVAKPNELLDSAKRPAAQEAGTQPPAAPVDAKRSPAVKASEPASETQQGNTLPSSTANPASFENIAAYGTAIAADQKPVELQVIQTEVAGCTRCPDLANSRTQTVFGIGNSAARLCLVGEAPGADEDRLGEPFVGAAGQLLDRILAACKLSRNDIYILNVLKCRPPRNRTPNENEVTNCWGFTHRQLEVIQPEFICCLGSVAARAVLQNRSSISRLRGSFHKYRSSQVVVTYHPAYLLRTPSAKQQTWEDMKMLMSAMGTEI